MRRGDTFSDGRPVELPTPDYDAYAESYANIPGDGLTDQDLGRGSAAQVVRFLDADLKMAPVVPGPTPAIIATSHSPQLRWGGPPT